MVASAQVGSSGAGEQSAPMRADPGTNGAGEEKVQPPAAETSDSAERRFQDLEQQAADAQSSVTLGEVGRHRQGPLYE